MGCKNDWTPDEIAWADEQNDKRIRRKIDIITRLACRYCLMKEKAGKPIPKYARRWWKEHKRLDEMSKVEKVARERLVKTMEKLTDEDLKVLGLKRPRP